MKIDKSTEAYEVGEGALCPHKFLETLKSGIQATTTQMDTKIIKLGGKD